MIPSRTVSANCPALPRVMWPKYRSFSFATLPINSLSRPNSVNIESFVRCSCYEMLSIFLQHHISKASILFLSNFFKVHPSTPYWNTAHTIDFITLTFDAVVIFRSFQILASTTAFCLAIAMRLLISLVQSQSADLYDPRNLQSCTCSKDSPSWSTCTELCYDAENLSTWPLVTLTFDPLTHKIEYFMPLPCRPLKPVSIKNRFIHFQNITFISLVT